MNENKSTAGEAAQIIDELVQCANVGRYDGKLVSAAKDWLAAHYTPSASSSAAAGAVTQAMLDAGTDALLAFRKSGADWTTKPAHAAEAVLLAAHAIRPAPSAAAGAVDDLVARISGTLGGLWMKAAEFAERGAEFDKGWEAATEHAIECINIDLAALTANGEVRGDE